VSRGEIRHKDVRRLAARARDDPEAFAALYDLYVDRVHAYAYRFLGSTAEAQDVTSQAFLTALANIRRFRWRAGGFGAWLFRIARNQAISTLRQQARLGPFLDTGTLGSDPEEEAARRETLVRLRALVAELPPRQREAVYLKYSAGLENPEIAAVTGRSVSAVSSLLHRATARLREGLQNDHEGPEADAQA